MICPAQRAVKASAAPEVPRTGKKVPGLSTRSDLNPLDPPERPPVRPTPRLTPSSRNCPDFAAAWTLVDAGNDDSKPGVSKVYYPCLQTFNSGVSFKKCGVASLCFALLPTRRTELD